MVYTMRVKLTYRNGMIRILEKVLSIESKPETVRHIEGDIYAEIYVESEDMRFPQTFNVDRIEILQ